MIYKNTNLVKFMIELVKYLIDQEADNNFDVISARQHNANIVLNIIIFNTLKTIFLLINGRED